MESICLLYGIPSLILTVFFLRFLNKTVFKYSFYRVLQCDLILNIFCYLNGWFNRFCSWSVTTPMMLLVYENCFSAFHLTRFGINFYFNAQALSVIVMSAHRLSTSMFVNSNEFWNKYYLRFYVFLTILSLILGLIPYLYGSILPLQYNYFTETFVSTPVPDEKKSLMTTLFFIECFTYLTSTVVINIITAISVRKRFAKDSASPKTKTLMKNLTKISVIHSSIFFLVFIWQLFGTTVMGAEDFQISMFILSDALSLSLPYILIGFDQNVCSTLGKIIGKKLASWANLENPSRRTTSVSMI